MLKKTLILLLTSAFLCSCSTNNDSTEVSSDKIIGTWNLISQKVNGLETINDCKTKTTFSFESSRVLRQVFYNLDNNNCTAGNELISSWFALGNDTYRINGSDGSRLLIELTFSDADTKYTVTETDANSIETVSIFSK